jgi:8-oxo-dGTP pyrophosphatase MutT (NUDIX family)
MELKPIERHRACAVCLKDDELLMVNIYDPHLETHYWMPPGGEIEDGEDSAIAAEREAVEETGVILKTLPETRLSKEYSFEYNGLWYLTKTEFFWATFESMDRDFDPNAREDEIFASEWVPLTMAFERMAQWEPIQTAVYELVFPSTRDQSGAINTKG